MSTTALKRSVAFASPESGKDSPERHAEQETATDVAVEGEQNDGGEQVIQAGEHYVGEDGQTYVVGEDGHHYILGEDGLYYWVDENGQTYVIGEDGHHYMVGEDGLRYWYDESGQQFVVGEDGIQYSVGEDGEHYWAGPDGQMYQVGTDYQYYMYGEDGLAYAVGKDGAFYPEEGQEGEAAAEVEDVQPQDSQSEAESDSFPIATRQSKPKENTSPRTETTPTVPLEGVSAPVVVTFSENRAWKASPSQRGMTLSPVISESSDGEASEIVEEDDDDDEEEREGVLNVVGNDNGDLQAINVPIAESNVEDVENEDIDDVREQSVNGSSDHGSIAQEEMDLEDSDVILTEQSEPMVKSSPKPSLTRNDSINSIKSTISTNNNISPVKEQFVQPLVTSVTPERTDKVAAAAIASPSTSSLPLPPSRQNSSNSLVSKAETTALSIKCVDLETRLLKEAEQNHKLQLTIRQLEENMRASLAERQQQMNNLVAEHQQQLRKQSSAIPNVESSQDVSDEDALADMVQAMIKSGMMAVLWCLRTQVVKKYAVAFNKWKLVVQTEVIRDHSAPSAVKLRSSPPTGNRPSSFNDRLIAEEDTLARSAKLSLADRYKHIVDGESSDEENQDVANTRDPSSVLDDRLLHSETKGQEQYTAQNLIPPQSQLYPTSYPGVPGASPTPRLFGSAYSGLSDGELDARRNMILGYAQQILHGVRIVDGIYPGPAEGAALPAGVLGIQDGALSGRSLPLRSLPLATDNNGRSRGNAAPMMMLNSNDDPILMSSPDHKYPIHAQQQLNQFHQQQRRQQNRESSPERLYNSFANYDGSRSAPNSAARSHRPSSTKKVGLERNPPLLQSSSATGARALSPSSPKQRYQEPTAASRALEYNYIPPRETSAPLTSFAMKMFAGNQGQYSPGRQSAATNPRQYDVMDTPQQFYGGQGANEPSDPNFFYPQDNDYYPMDGYMDALSASALRPTTAQSRRKVPSYMQPTSTSFKRDRHRDQRSAGAGQEPAQNSNSREAANGKRSAESMLRTPAEKASSRRPSSSMGARGNSRSGGLGPNGGPAASSAERRRQSQQVVPNTTHNRLVDRSGTGQASARVRSNAAYGDNYAQQGIYYNDRDDGVLSDITYHVDHSYQRASQR